ncbi:MAG TPA: M1 family metallopeptidase [Bacteroidota bacterium]|nr:M1 family metallopeptidase [Bacteroidota bacterium]
MRSALNLLVAGSLALLVVSANSVGQTIFKEPLSPRIVTYKISVALDPKQKMLHGSERLTWRNTSTDRVGELQFHLYFNAFKNTASTFMKESGGVNRGFELAEGGWGWTDVTSMKTAEGEDLTGRIQWIHPDDDNDKDQTVIRVPLTKPVLPGQTIQLDVAFTAQLPRVFARTGYYQNFFMMGQWFPKIGVYEATGQRYATTGQWNCHQFHANTEFYADYGVYDVDMTVPKEYVVGATGLLSGTKDNGDGTKTETYHAEDVHDFAWTASPSFVDLSDQWNHVKIRVLMQPQRRHQAVRYFESVKATLAYFDKHVGRYPYPNVTIVDPAYGATGAGGMEYPTLITAGSMWGIGTWAKFAEIVTIHEFGHQYWYGLVGSNEFEEAWMDEGFNQYYETRIADDAYGRKTSAIDLPGLKLGDFEMTRSGYTSMHTPKIAPTATPAWQFKQGGYSNMTYEKTAAFMTTLERLIGTDVMDTLMKTYFERWKFKHPCGRDFIAVANEVVPKFHGNKFGKDLGWFFNQVLYGTDICDYELSTIESKELSSPKGVFDSDGKKVTAGFSGDSTSKSKLFESRVVASRLGEVKLPTSVLVHFENGQEVREPWDGQSRWVEFRYTRPEKVAWAIVDPDTAIVVDVNLNNNSKSLDPPRAPLWKYTFKFLFWMENMLGFGI